MPKKSFTRGGSSNGLFDEGVVFSRPENSPPSTLPLDRPLSNVSGIHRPWSMLIRDTTYPRHTRSSSGFTAYASYFFPPGLSSRPPSPISVSSSQMRPVRQLFEPALPDELSLVRYGEHLTVLRSFDDGWCLVARDTSRSSRASRVSTWIKSNYDNANIGLVPAWAFSKPLKGVTVTRPFRVESIDALRPGRSPAYARDTIISGSDFA